MRLHSFPTRRSSDLALRPGSLADDTDMLDRRSAHAERAMDDLRKKFGNAAVIRGIAYDGPEKAG